MSRLNDEPGNGGDAGERLASKTQRVDAEQIASRVHLAGSVALRAELCISSRHSLAVVGHADELLSPGGDFDGDAPGFGVYGVLDELLDYRSRSLDHLAGGYLPHYTLGEQLNFG